MKAVLLVLATLSALCAGPVVGVAAASPDSNRTIRWVPQHRAATRAAAPTTVFLNG